MNQVFIDAKWDTARHELDTILQTERSYSDGDKSLTIENVFEHYIELYFRYISIAKVLNTCYDEMTHPKKRNDMKDIMVPILYRLIDLRYQLFHLNPCCLEISKNQMFLGGNRHPWQYINMNKYLSMLQYRLGTLDTLIPSFFKDDDKERRNERRMVIESYTQLKFSMNSITLEDTVSEDEKQDEEIVLGPKPSSHNTYNSSFFRECSSVRRTKCATSIQKCFRGYRARCEIQRFSQQERELIGMCIGSETIKDDGIQRRLNENYDILRQNQIDYEEEYSKSLLTLKRSMKIEKEFDIKQELMRDRVTWVTEQIGLTNTIPESLDEFYKSNIQVALKNTGNGVCCFDNKDRSSIGRPHTLLSLIEEKVLKFETAWNNNSKIYFEEHAEKKEQITDEIYQEAIKEVDDLLLRNLKRMKALQDAPSSNTSKKSKDKKKTKKSSKGKARGNKVLPGEKLQGLKSMDTAHMLSILIEHKLINHVKDTQINDFIGSELPTECREINNRQRPYSSISQLRNIIVENCILPLGSKKIRDMIDEKQSIRSILMYGPEKCGKTMITELVANSVDALVINLSPSRIPQEFLTEKHGTTKLVHMAFTVAKDPKFAPVVIYIDECDQYFQSSKKKNKGNAVLKLQKDLLIYKNQSLTSNDRVIIIGCSRCPWNADMKVMKWKGPAGKAEKQGFFEHCIHIPCPSHEDRMIIWKTMIHKMVKSSVGREELNYTLLSNASEHYSTGMIRSCIEKVLAAGMIGRVEFNEDMFIKELQSMFKPVREDEYLSLEYTDSFYTLQVNDKEVVKSKNKKT